MGNGSMAKKKSGRSTKSEKARCDLRRRVASAIHNMQMMQAVYDNLRKFKPDGGGGVFLKDYPSLDEIDKKRVEALRRALEWGAADEVTVTDICDMAITLGLKPVLTFEKYDDDESEMGATLRTTKRKASLKRISTKR